MMRLSAITAAALLSGFGFMTAFAPLPASAGETCKALSDYKSAVMARVRIAEVKHFKGAHAEKFMAGFNKLTPDSDHAAEEILVITPAGHPVSHIGFAADGCLIGSASVPLAKSRPIILAAQ